LVDVDEVKAGFASGRLDMARFVLVMWFIVEQRWRYIIEKELEPDGITAKQWLMLIVIGNAFRSPPSIQEVADAMSTTHQNVKQIAASMERRGFMTLSGTRTTDGSSGGRSPTGATRSSRAVRSTTRGRSSGYSRTSLTMR